MEYLIRPCYEKDLPRLVELCEHHASYEQSTFNATHKSERLRKALFSEKPLLYCFLVEINQQLEGYFTFTFDFSTWDAQLFLHLDCLYLEPDFRGLKIGDQVFEKLQLIASQTNCVNIQWQTPINNEKAIGFYNRMGAKSKEKIRFTMKINDVL